MISNNEVRAVLASVVGTSFLRGYMRGVMCDPRLALFQWITGVQPTNMGLMKFIMSEDVQSVWMSVIAVDSLSNMGGALIFPSLAKKFGRRGAMLVGSYTIIFASLLCGYSLLFNSKLMFYFGLFIFGFNNGMFSGLAPAYLLEISRRDRRGVVTCTYELAHSIGFVVAHVISVKLADHDRSAWPFAISLVIFAWIISVYLLPTCPRSPRMLYSIKLRTFEAKKALEWLRNSDCINDELQELHDEYVCNRVLFKNFTWKDVFVVKIFRKCMFVSILVTFSRQLCGMDLIDTAPHFILTTNGYNFNEMPEIILGMQLSKVAMNIVAMCLVEGKLGRRNLILISIIGCAMAFFAYLIERLSNHSYGFLALLPQYCLCMSYGLGLGPVTRFVPFELFPVFASLRASSFALAMGELLRLPAFLGFFWMFGSVTGWISFNFLTLNLVFYFLLKTNLPETKNKSFFDVYKSM
uniref:Sugar transporter n=1 Tax=Nilaparvata lugens TaxID=108931 RepID=A0A0A8J8N4_NILLU|nr:sugar transporter [Nilaparvata lugens]